MLELKNYVLGDVDCLGELMNTLAVLDAELEVMNKSIDLVIVGGCAFHYWGFDNNFTNDIDTILKIEDPEVKDVAESLGVSDDAAEVVSLPSGYQSRVSHIKRFNKINASVVSKADLVLSKLSTGRSKDISDIVYSGILSPQVIAEVDNLLLMQSDVDDSRKHRCFEMVKSMLY